MKVIKKIFKVLLIIILALVALIGIFLLVLSKRPSVPENYTETVATGGELETKYLGMGPHEVGYTESGAMMSFKKFELWYPTDLTQTEEKLPVVIFVNGTGVKGSKYPALQKHMASWGFLTVATEEEYAWNGFSAEMCLRYLEVVNALGITENDQVKLPAGKVDLDRVGVTGHSQGGIGVVNAITDQHHSDLYKAAVILSCGRTDFSEALLWSFDETKIQCPTLMIGSTGNTDSQIASRSDLQKLYDNIPESVPKLLMRRNDADHGEMLYYADGYVTAWFLYYLCDDSEAGRAFFGEDAEVLSNALYQDVVVHP